MCNREGGIRYDVPSFSGALPRARLCGAEAGCDGHPRVGDGTLLARTVPRQTRPWRMPLRTAMTRYGVEPDRRLRWLHVMLPLAFSLSVVLSWKLWVSSRLFPLSPVSVALPTLPFPLDDLGLLLLLGCLVASAIAAQPRTLLLTGCAFVVVLSLLDQMRWQPWVYQYLCMLTALGVYAGKTPAGTHQGAALTICRLIVVATYFWSGVHKLNATFVRETWPDLASAALRLLSPAVQQLPPVVWLSIPLLEMGVGLGLLARPSRQAAVLLGLVTHLVVLTCLL